MTKVFKRIYMCLLSLLMITTTIGCNTSKTNWEKLTEDEKVDKVL